MKRKEKPRPTIGMRIRAWWARWKDWLFKEKKTPPGIGERITNIAVNNFRGILGFFVPLCALGWRVGKGPLTTVENCWIFMIWFFFFQPVPVPVVGLWPIIYLPLFGALSTDETVKCYFNENIILFVIASMLLLLLNNSGFDRRLALWFLCSGDACQFSGKRMVFKCSLAAFVLSMFCSRLIVTSTLTQYVTPIYLNLRSSLGNSDKVPDYDVIRCVINNAIQTSSAIGSIAILHSAYCTLAFKAIWCESAAKGKEYPDIFNYLQWSAYAFPLAFVMWLFAVSYHMMLINFFGRRPMNAAAMNDVRNALLKTKQSIPKKSTTHERLSVVFALLALLIFFLRWNNYMEEKGWAAYRQPPKKDTGGGKDTGDDGDNQEEEPSAILRDKDGILHPARPALRIIERYIMEEAPVIKDATVAAIFVMALHVLPRTFGFLHLFDAEKRSQLKDIKPESAILWWRFVDKNTNYGYFFLIGSGVALNLAVKESLLADNIGNYIGMELINKHNWNTALFLICLYSCILTNMMTGVAALVVLMPLVLNAGQYTTTSPWQGKIYLGGLGVAVGTSLGFMWPFMYTPAYFCHHVGKVPLKRMALYSFPLVIICMLLLWFSLCYWAPFLWDPLDRGVYPIESPITVSLASTTAAPPPPPPSGDVDGGGNDASG